MWLVAIWPCFAAERFVRDVADLPASSVRALVEGADHRVWVGTYNGLWVLDGAAARRVAAEALPGLVDALALDAEGRVWARHEGGEVRVVTDVPGEGPGPVGWACETGVCAERGYTDVRSLAGLSGQTPALLRADGVELAGHAPVSAADGWRLLAGEDSLWLAGRSTLWRVGAAALERVADVGAVVGVAAWPGQPGVLAVADFSGRLLRVAPDGSAEVVIDDAGRGISLVRRGATLWFSVDRALIAWRDDHAERLGATEGVRGGGPLLVGHDGSMWLGDFLGAHVLPEPDTRSFADADGLPSAHARYLTTTAGRLWVGTWQGVGSLDALGRPLGGAFALQVEGGFCSAGGGAWAGARDMRGDGEPLRFAALHVDADGVRVVDDAFPAWPRSCATTADGTTWFATLAGLWRMPPGAARPEAVAPDDVDGPAAADGGDLLIGTRRALLRFRDGRLVDQTPLDLHARPTALVAVGAEWWLSTEGDGVRRISAAGVRPLTLDGEPTPLHLLGITPTADGVWLAGQGTLMRVDTGATPRVLERVGAWHGLRVDGAEQVVPRADGGLWIASSWGVVDVPASARVPAGAAPPAVAAAPPEGRALDRTPDGLRLPAAPNDLSLAWALPAWREPSRSRLRVVVDGAARPLSGAAIRFVDLAPGAHRVEVESSLDGQVWTPGPRVDLVVATPWFRQPAVLGAAALGVALALALAYRLRVAALLRVERERARIALDLHDEVGSGLAGIATLAALAALPDTPDDTRRGLADRVAGAAGELGDAMGDIVWSLRRDSEDPAALLALLAERGNRLLAAHDGSVVVDAPARFPGRLSLPVRRALQRIGLEALHNAARHGRAHTVRVVLTPSRRWTFRVEDDGAPATAATRGSGLGLRGMAARAAAIGAEFTAGPRAGGGFAVEVRFDPGAGGSPSGPAWLRRLSPS